MSELGGGGGSQSDDPVLRRSGGRTGFDRDRDAGIALEEIDGGLFGGGGCLERAIADTRDVDGVRPAIAVAQSLPGNGTRAHLHARGRNRVNASAVLSLIHI